MKNQIQERVKQEIDKQQRDYYLQQQMRTIQDELGDGADADIEKMREEAKKKNWPKEVGETFEKELQKVERLNPAVAEYSVQMTYLQLLLELPWNDTTKDNLDLKCAREQLDRDHFGLDEVKERILEHLAVIKLKGDLKVADPLPLRPSGRGQDLAGQVGGGGAGPQVRPHFAGRPARRVRDSRTPPHLHRCHAGPDHPDHQAVRFVEPL